MKKVNTQHLNRDGKWHDNGIWYLIEDEDSLWELSENQFLGTRFIENKINALQEYGKIFVNELGGYHGYNPEYHKYKEVE